MTGSMEELGGERGTLVLVVAPDVRSSGGVEMTSDCLDNITVPRTL